MSVPKLDYSSAVANDRQGLESLASNDLNISVQYWDIKTLASLQPAPISQATSLASSDDKGQAAICVISCLLIRPHCCTTSAPCRRQGCTPQLEEQIGRFPRLEYKRGLRFTQQSPPRIMIIMVELRLTLKSDVIASKC